MRRTAGEPAQIGWRGRIAPGKNYNALQILPQPPR
jgi:hypothetical protein